MVVAAYVTIKNQIKYKCQETQSGTELCEMQWESRHQADSCVANVLRQILNSSVGNTTLSIKVL